ncbi:TetR family transcriptional regulator [Streptomyces sp. CNQ-509]|uniref:TetR/AcrR family transcriptional regulator n=1 Tax=unclassified Streptomyces TaxID=2593676 RepID=UPI00062DCC3A|nr:TetR family transcriptional regulator [Streptomyces sp. CNQ-509]AKH81425.1 TetR family transcriptional regulator [Streptomyces sp. CNQ-509]
MRTETGAADGRVQRGQERRRLLLAATVRVIGRGGVAAVTHRAVAAEAGVPKSVATYHFPAVADLLAAALSDSVDAYATALAGALPESYDTADLGRHLAAYLDEHGARCAAEFDLYLYAARHPELRPVLGRWHDLLAGIAGRFTSDPVAVTAFSAALDGLSLQSLLRDEPLTAAEIQQVVDHVLHRR